MEENEEIRVEKPLGKVLALDLGDAWIGIAISDALRMLARPLTTVKPFELESYLKKLFSQEKILIVVVGNPITMRGTASAQTDKIAEQKRTLETQFPQQQWILWDERLSSKRATSLQRELGKKHDSDRKIKEHSMHACRNIC